MEKEGQLERAAIIEYLRSKDDFFKKVNFDRYTFDELKKFMRRWDALPEYVKDKNKGG